MKRKLLLLSAVGSAVGIAGGLVYALESSRRKRLMGNSESNDAAPPTERSSSMARIENKKATAQQSEPQHQIDDQGTDQAEAAHILKEIRDAAFDASNEKLALALGRPTEEIEEWASGNGLIDGDVVMKARALAIQRDLDI